MKLKTPNPKPELRCRFCSNVYHKREHLERHERIHTGDKPFVCAICNRTFSRNDSLMRHERVHAAKNDANPNKSRKARNSSVKEGSHAPEFPSSTQLRGYGNGPETSAGSSGSSLPNSTVVHALGGEPPVFAETEDFFQYLLSIPPGWPTSLPSNMSAGTQFIDPELGGQQTEQIYDTSPQAVQQAGAVIHDASSSITREINGRGITSSFLDSCLHLFFTRFNPTFPILHEATFNISQCGPFLLLTMVAIGSLFFRTDDAVAKGEFLWRLTQTAAATSWGDIFDGKVGAYRVQREAIVTTACLGQLYAMLSKSKRLRTLSQTLHGLAFSWARQFGMFDLPENASSGLQNENSTLEEMDAHWKAWAAVEVNRRTVLGLYIIDAQLARYAGAAPVGKHTTNPLKFAARDSVFEARTATDWVNEMKRPRSPTSTFREILLSLFYPSSFTTGILDDSQLSKLVILEAFQAILSEYADANGSALGIPPLSQITSASLYLKAVYLDPAEPKVESQEHLLRWHNLCLDIATDSVVLCQRLCMAFSIDQNLFSTGRDSPEPISLSRWANSSEARRALLHAVAILDLSESMTLGRAYPAHLPACLFAAATIFTAHCRYGQQLITIPAKIDWDVVWSQSTTGDSSLPASASSNSPVQNSDTSTFVVHNGSLEGETKQLNLHYSLLALQLLLQSISSQWGISHDMLPILSIWITGLS